MADKRITDLPELIQADNGDFIPIVDSSMNITKRVAAEKVLPNSSVIAALIPDGGVPPAKRSGGFKVGTFSIASGASGSLPVTGVGFKPKFIRITELPGNSTSFSTSSYGATDGTTQFVTGVRVESSNRNRWTQTNAVVNVRNVNGSSLITAVFSSFDDDGFTLSIATASAGIDFGYEAFA